MTKFKFGDKIWHDEYGNGVYGKSYGKSSSLNVTTLSQVMFESIGCINVLMSEITPATDWVKCSERMPDIDVEVLVYFDGYIYIDSLYYDKNLKEYWWQGNCRLPTHWMQLPEMPEVKE